MDNEIRDDDIICPECGCNISLKEEDKKKRFEDFHSVTLAAVRKKAKKSRAIIGASVMMAFCAIMLYSTGFLQNLGTRDWWVVYFDPLILLFYGAVGVFFGSLKSSPSKEEKKLWENFK